ncbi:hypothetical protein JOF53_000744 [Crossiella equi]|uniref:Nucleotidyltransferase-like protein n=1 Tax=Crossiella equi TaxID=130796 RepID=A0ABS5A6L6_9PSEU|nr:nucleotidyltransferase family protein [Crossiella equi]MBP2471872.1 hypothetical protein [Crossiella equi]
MWLPPVEEIVAAFLPLEVPHVPFRYVQFSRNEQRTMPTLVSYWEATGAEVPEPLALETRYERERQAAYRSVLARVQSLDPTAVPMKGPTICGLYPEPLVRETADLDVLCSSPEAVWAVAEDLRGLGWNLSSVSVTEVDGRLQPGVQLNRPSKHPRLTNKDRVELTAVCYRGDHFRLPARPRTLTGAPTLADCFTWFVDEIAEREFRMRDMVDLAVLDHHLRDRGDLAAIARNLVDYQLRPAFRRLCAEAARRYPAALPVLDQIRAALPRRAALPARTAPRLNGPVAGSIAVANYTARETERASVVARCEKYVAAVQEKVGARRLYELGVPLHGVELSEERAETANLEFHGPGALLRCPAGTYALTAGGVLRDTWLTPLGVLVQ